MWETWVRYQSWKDPQEEGMETQSGILAWRIKMATGAFQAIVHGVAKCWTQWYTFGGIHVNKTQFLP